jgi:hypothetical protein
LLPVFIAKDNIHFLAKEAVDIEYMSIFQLLDYVFGSHTLNSHNSNSEIRERKRVYLRSALFEELQEDIVFPSFLLNENEKFSETLSGLWIGCVVSTEN